MRLVITLAQIIDSPLMYPTIQHNFLFSGDPVFQCPQAAESHFAVLVSLLLQPLVDLIPSTPTEIQCPSVPKKYGTMTKTWAFIPKTGQLFDLVGGLVKLGCDTTAYIYIRRLSNIDNSNNSPHYGTAKISSSPGFGTATNQEIAGEVPYNVTDHHC
jgi:hypothetical protein